MLSDWDIIRQYMKHSGQSLFDVTMPYKLVGKRTYISWRIKSKKKKLFVDGKVFYGITNMRKWEPLAFKDIENF